MNKSKTVKQLILNTLSGWGSVVMRSLIALLMIPVLLKTLGKDGYGLVGLLSVFVSLSNVADLGLRQALGRELSEQVALEDENAFAQLASTALVLYLVLALVLSAIGFVLAPYFVKWMKVPDILLDQAVFYVRLYGCVAIVLSFVTPVFSSGLTAHLRFDLVNHIQIISSMSANVILLLAISLFATYALPIWVGIMLLNSCVVCILNVYFYRKHCSSNGKLNFSIKLDRLTPLFQLGGYMYLLQVTFAISNQSAPLVVSSFFGTGGVALYQPGGRISELLRPVVLTLTNQLYPLTTKHFANKDEGQLSAVLIWGTKYTLMLGVLVSSALFVLAEPLCRIWLAGSLENYAITVNIMKCWAVVDLLTYMTGSQMSVLLGMKEMRFLVWSQVPTAILSVAIGAYFVGYTSIGISGVLYGAMLMNLVRRPLLIWYTAKRCNVNLFDYLRKSYLGSVLIYLLLMTSGTLFLRYYDLNSLLHLLAFSLVFGCMWLFCTYWIVLSSDERLSLTALIFQYFSDSKS